MKTLALLIALPAMAVLHSADAGETAPASTCTAAVHHEFDFWIGDWVVTEKGQPAGTNHVDRLLEGCALFENWVGIDGSRGHSLNFYDRRRDLWQETWVDASPSALNLTGHFSAGHMVLTGQSVDIKTHKPRVDRITWTPNADGTVRQLWDLSLDGGRTWKVAFDGLYTRKPASP
jgi:hypothetical protein